MQRPIRDRPNFLYAASIISKIQSSDALILLDEVQYTKGGWSARNKAPDGSWLTVPVERHCAFKPINRVRIGEPRKDWRSALVADLLRYWPGLVTEQICQEILRPYRLLVGLNVAILRIILGNLAPDVIWAFQSHLEGGHIIPAVSDDATALKPISYRLAVMVEELGCDVYLSGPSGRRYLDETPFQNRGIRIEYSSHEGENHCALALIDQGQVASPSAAMIDV